MKKEMEEIPDELNPDLMLNTIASELLIKIAKEIGRASCRERV